MASATELSSAADPSEAAIFSGRPATSTETVDVDRTYARRIEERRAGRPVEAEAGLVQSVDGGHRGGGHVVETDDLFGQHDVGHLQVAVDTSGCERQLPPRR